MESDSFYLPRNEHQEVYPQYCLLEGGTWRRTSAQSWTAYPGYFFWAPINMGGSAAFLPSKPVDPARSRAPVHSSVGILPAGRPLTRSLYIRKRGAKNRYHFSKIDCELLEATLRSPDYRTITLV